MSQCLNPDCKLVNQPNTKFCQRCGNKLLLADRYRAVQIIGQGGFGRTFRAVDEHKPSKPPCVIKQFYPQAQGTDTLQKAAELFEQEAVRLDELGKHPQIPELFAYFTQDGRQYLVQEFIDGQNLAQILTSEGYFSEKQIWNLLKDLLPVLEFIHKGQVIHRDIKPENIIRRSNGQLVLVDFGAAKYATATALGVTGTVIGSAGYAAPEQGIGKAIYASDIYSLGVTCIHLLTQVEPFELYSISEGDWVWRDYLPNPISKELGQVLDKMIQGATKRRYQSVAEVLNDINGSPIAPPKISVPQPPQPKFISQSFTEDLGNGVKLDMVYIPGGTFTMGAPVTEEGSRNSERPQHSVTIKAFLMGKYPVTQAQWQAVAKLPKVNRDLNPDPSRFKGANRPVERVSWYDAVEFCDRLCRLTGKAYRLPSEAEWEYACRAGTTTPFYFGRTITPELANYDGNYTYGSGTKGKYRQETTTVGSFPPNKFGLYDLHGNVWEWCADHWHSDYQGAPNDETIWLSSDKNSSRLLRGGSWYDDPGYCRSACRHDLNADYDNLYFGFRIVCSAEWT
ncbi:SUMF1/EgtB/PvdO family nonheme iron enzyme [Floridanema evergladense]|uniref:SUMF1/EgtB/PvdO family nonheme iron enzyme n=1 Tax=Floridaenema evergladense BLCC-F167 TaxID=3153639 RepID=A0ABV4WXH8_9CYAN